MKLKNTLLPTTISLLSTPACAATLGDYTSFLKTQSILLILGLLAIGLLLAYSYRLRMENYKLQDEAKKYKLKLSEYISMHEQMADPVKSAPAVARATAASSSNGEAKQGVREQYTKNLYWSRLGSTIEKSSFTEVSELEARKSHLDEMIRIAREKLERREMDEKTFGEFMAERQMELVEIEAKINRMKNGGA